MWSCRTQAEGLRRKPENNTTITSRIFASSTLCAGQQESCACKCGLSEEAPPNEPAVAAAD